MTPAIDRARGGLRWLDRHRWVFVVATFAGSEIGLTVWEHLSSGPILLARADTIARALNLLIDQLNNNPPKLPGDTRKITYSMATT